MRRAAIWLALRLPTGANWRYSRFGLMRRLGDWWLPIWGWIAYGLDNPAANPSYIGCDQCDRPATCFYVAGGSRWNWCDDHPSSGGGYYTRRPMWAAGAAPNDSASAIGGPCPQCGTWRVFGSDHACGVTE